MSELLELLWVFARLSLVAFGGGIGILPEMEREAVGAHGWVTHREFVDAFALSQVTPGPGMLMVAMIGYRVAGIPGAAAASAGMFVPAATATWLVADRWSRLGDHPVVEVARRTVSPVGLGLLGAGVYTLFRIGVEGVGAAFLAAGAFLMVAWWNRSPALAVVLGAGAGLVLFR
ncbi:MAG: chromate transporter [Thermoflexaceae bacterium]|nr:chromate transporter [Thermoflexaceae bacterium]